MDIVVCLLIVLTPSSSHFQIIFSCNEVGATTDAAAAAAAAADDDDDEKPRV